MTSSRIRPHNVTTPLAVGLSHQSWNSHALHRYLATKLPATWKRIPKVLANDLITTFPGTVAPDSKQIADALRQSGHFARILEYARKHQTVPEPVLTSPEFHPTPALQGCRLPVLTCTQELADWLALPVPQLLRFSDLHGLSARSASSFGPHYIPHLVPKADGPLRLIEEPRPVLKKLQRRLLNIMLNHVPLHDAVYGFRKGRNCIQNAACHGGEALVLRFDLAHFFPSVSFERVYGLFRTMGYPPVVARHLGGLTTAITPPSFLTRRDIAARDTLSRRHLPQGAPTSPALANLAAYHLDCRLSGLARSLNAAYTRYADDLTFSGDNHIRATIRAAVPKIVQDCGFALNPTKTRNGGTSPSNGDWADREPAYKPETHRL